MHIYIYRSSVRRVRYDKNLVCVFSCAGPVVEVWDPAMRSTPAAAAAADGLNRMGENSNNNDILITNSSSSGRSEKSTATKGLFAYALSEETRGFEIGTSAALPSPEEEESSGQTNNSIGGGGNGGGGNGGSGNGNGNRRSLHGANPNKNRDGAPVNVVALDVKYIEVGATHTAAVYCIIYCVSIFVTSITVLYLCCASSLHLQSPQC